MVFGQSRRVGPHLFLNIYLQSHFEKIVRFNWRARALPNIVDRGRVHTLLQFRRGRMQRKQISCEGQLGLKVVGQWAKASAAVLFVAILVSLSGCQKYFVTVEVPIPPKFTPPGNIKEVNVQKFEGPIECAGELQNGVQARAANGGFTNTIPDLPDLEGPLDINGKVDACAIRMGHGVLNATMVLSHGGKQLRQEIVKEETNRPGASTEEVRTTLVHRVENSFASIFVPGKKSEIREVRPKGKSDPGWIAADRKDWKQAVEWWSKWISEDPTDHRAWYSRGVAHEGLGKFREAVDDYKKALKLEQDELYTRALVHAEKSAGARAEIEAAQKARE
jgi:Tetratricopeptide repeat